VFIYLIAELLQLCLQGLATLLFALAKLLAYFASRLNLLGLLISERLF